MTIAATVVIVMPYCASSRSTLPSLLRSKGCLRSDGMTALVFATEEEVSSLGADDFWIAVVRRVTIEGLEWMNDDAVGTANRMRAARMVGFVCLSVC